MGGLLPLTGAVSEFGENFMLVGDLAAKHFEEAGFPVDFDENGNVITPIEIWKYVEYPPYIERVSTKMVIPPK